MNFISNPEIRWSAFSLPAQCSRLELKIFRAERLLLFAFSLLFLSLPARAEEKVLDMVVASVDGEPITLSEIEATQDTNVSPRDIARNPQLRNVLDSLILRKVLVEETKERNITATKDEVDRYMQEIAKQNGMGVENFIAALERQGKSISSYREEIRVEILRSKLVAQLMRDQSGVTDAQIDTYLESHPELYNGQEKVKLNQVMMTPLEEETPNLSADIESALQRAKEAGSLEILQEELSDRVRLSQEQLVVDRSDLAPIIQEAIEGKKPGELTEVIRLPGSYAVFSPVQILGPFSSTQDKELREYVHSVLEEDVQRAALEDYFGTQLLERHDIDKKL